MTSLPVDRLDLLIFLSKELLDVHFHNGVMFGNLPITSSYTVDVIENALTTLSLLRYNNLNEFEINIHGHFYPKFSDYLAKADRRLIENIPNRFYIFEYNFLCENKTFINSPEIIFNFYNTARLFDAISKVADYKNKNNENLSCIFYFKEHLEITNKYSVENITKIDFIDDFIDEFIEDRIHKEQKRAIIRNTIFEKYSNLIDITDIARSFNDFFKSIRDGYQLYINEFSFESFKNDLDDIKRDYVLKINKIFTDIQNQVLAIPVATIIAAGQMKSYDKDLANLLINIFILLGVFVFSFILRMVLKNQLNSLGLIKYELEAKIIKIQSMKTGSYQTNFRDTINSLIERNEDVELNIFRIHIMLYISVLITISSFTIRFFY